MLNDAETYATYLEGFKKMGLSLYEYTCLPDLIKREKLWAATKLVGMGDSA